LLGFGGAPLYHRQRRGVFGFQPAAASRRLASGGGFGGQARAFQMEPPPNARADCLLVGSFGNACWLSCVSIDSCAGAFGIFDVFLHGAAA
jgi:hypothetical protein